MRRQPEAELMCGAEQVAAYAGADFSGPNQLFVELFAQLAGEAFAGRLLDLGCGPGDICLRLARRFPASTLLGLDGSRPMLERAEQICQTQGLTERLTFHHSLLPDASLPAGQFDAALSNSLLHHLPDPMVLWQTVRPGLRPNGLIVIMDLLRPADQASARRIVQQYAAGEPPILQEDFHNSLLAAYRIPEVEAQLKAAGLTGCTVQQVSDRHLAVTGRLA